MNFTPNELELIAHALELAIEWEEPFVNSYDKDTKPRMQRTLDLFAEIRSRVLAELYSNLGNGGE